MPDLIYSTVPAVTFATNTFINVPIILQFDETPLIALVKEESLGFTSEIPIYHSDGTYLAKVRGTRIYATDDGRKAGVEIKQFPGLWVCSVDGRPAFEIRQEPGDKFRTTAELYTPTGYFLRAADKPTLDLLNREALRVGGVTMSGNMIVGSRIGVLIRSNGSVAIGVN